MKITGAVRVIKGQEILPDGSTLEEHGIIDGSTVNIVIEPDKEISLKIKLGPKEFTQKVMNSVRVRELKLQLIDDGSVGFSVNNFTLIISADDNDGFTADIPLLEESLPLHLHGVGNDTTISIVGECVMTQLVSHRGSRLYYTFSKNMKISQLKQTVNYKCKFFDNTNYLVNFWAFVENGETYRKLDDDVTVGASLSDNDVIYFVEDRIFTEAQLIPVYYGRDLQIGRVGCVEGDDVLSLKLRVQELMGFPVKSVDYKQDGESLENNKRVNFKIGYYDKPTTQRIDVS